MSRRAALVLGLSSALGACNVFYSLDDYAAPSLASCSSCAAERCQCAPKAPAGFDHARLLVPAKASSLCPSGTVAGVAMGQGASDTGCACSCASPAPGGACALAVYTGKGCKGSPVKTLADATCASVGASSDPLSAAIVPAAGACTPSAERVEPSFDVPVLACLDQLPGTTGCDDRTTCTAAADAPFDPSPCIVAKAGASVDCPDSYSHRYVFATGFDDQRTCDGSQCACSPQKCPDTKVSLCQDSICSLSCNAWTGGGCKDFGGLTHGRVDFDGKTEGECTPSGSATASGSLTATGSVVVCCRGTLPG